MNYKAIERQKVRAGKQHPKRESVPRIVAVKAPKPPPERVISVSSASADVARARQDQATYGISERDYQAWRAQMHSANCRGIPFRFTLLGWSIWWRIELKKIGPHAMRGRQRDCYVMARKGDRGPYEPANVKCIKPLESARDRDPDDKAAAVVRIAAVRAANGHPLGQHLRVRGDGHPKSKAVLTPAGRFGSIALAADHYGITRAGASLRVKRGAEGWTYAPTCP